jgi:hypothetical protein
MNTPNADRWKALAGQIRLNAMWCVVGSTWIGIELGADMWRRRSPFHPFDLMFWGFITALYVWHTLVGPNQLSSTVPLAVANERKKEARSLTPYILGTALTSFSFALCSLAAKQFGRLCLVGALALGALLILMVWATERKIKHVARGFYRPAGESQLT